MLRKIKSLSVLSMLFISPTFAGFYIGAAGGPEGASFAQRSHVVRPATLDVIDREHFSGLGGFGSIFGGFEQTLSNFYGFNQLYWAAELNANLSSLRYQLTNDEYFHGTFSKTIFRIRDSEGLSLLPGYALTAKTVLYGRIGYANGRLRIIESDPTINNFNKRRSGIRYGGGIKHRLNHKFAIRMDYSQITYQHVKGFVYEPFGMVAKTSKISATTAQVAFGLIYSFDEPKIIYVK